MIVKDIYLAAFLIDNSIKLSDYNSDGIYITFKFEIDKETEKKMKIEYMDSKYRDVKSKIEKLRGLVK